MQKRELADHAGNRDGSAAMPLVVPCAVCTVVKTVRGGRQLRLDCASRFIRRYFVSMAVSRCIASEFTHLGCRQYVFAGLMQRGTVSKRTVPPTRHVDS